MFMRRAGDHQVANNSYESSWMGGNSDKASTMLGKDGKLVIGIFGSSGGEVDSLGLIQSN